MFLRENINCIINSDTEMDKGQLILIFLEKEGMKMDEDGWLDDDRETAGLVWEHKALAELERVLSE